MIFTYYQYIRSELASVTYPKYRCLGSWRGCDSEALLQAVRCLGSWRGCDRYLGSLRGAIAKRCCKQFAVWEVEGVRSLFGKLRGCDRIADDYSYSSSAKICEISRAESVTQP
ncbi:hypothetical protein VB638_05845 [Dolichospermum sp. UHCC 0684]|uniref:hypothetical protein n=1 Tax=unclassified Dolichospermum TaxID=2622029 RepID=UPI001446A4E2|nr:MULTISPECIES: hypothetical protein [unclassified Dolichospermum]MEA5529113.1 hypothetical protein [Dolichospermum sp. UHCC 0684]MTJ35879.1 hypothetical protein [Dolichospermum sp. UHCC 0260]